MKSLTEILNGIDYTVKGTVNDISVSGICFDSREVARGDLFIAVRGTKTDGHKYIDDAVRQGAKAVICESVPGHADPRVCWIRVSDSAYTLAVCASNYYDNPSAEIKLVGITGTNGKTTTASLLYRIFTMLGYKVGLLSTISNYIAGKEVKATLTTPDPVKINRLLREMIESGCEYAFMEVSSHAVVQKRITSLTFSMGIFTNLSHDHLDYHGTFDNYLRAKKEFFDHLPAGSLALVNADDNNGKIMLQNCKADKYEYSLKTVADYTCRIIEHRFDGMNIKFDNHEVWTTFIGEFNAYNLLAAASAADLLGQDRLEVLTNISRLKPVPGRFEVIRSVSGKTAVVDYAHTPDALDNVLSAINKIKHEGNNIITVVGAGGDRDCSKRPLMAKISVAHSDRVILTSDNPRNEDPEKIIDDMIRGVPVKMQSKVLRITNRREAIRTATMMANEDDIILIAGKGHETYQEIKGHRYHFDDREELRKIFMSAN
ncbi:MAG TPA: UDP-N-acetylmuramoyl-L-alanyl-D-glutamate--2,6-diaminopimelate ligase [Bacteroidales bacterium]|nr:UDP-N-acetylmuramoyl-L-alanyl-D-glutamate--2,6-diaminopimelate ligase [Bacteroidales bacterium]